MNKDGSSYNLITLQINVIIHIIITAACLMIDNLACCSLFYVIDVLLGH